LNRGKKSISINLKLDQGVEIVNELVKKSDVMISNMAPGSMTRLGLGYDTVSKINPAIIYCTISCFGHYGSYTNEPGFDLIAQAASGWCGQSDPPTQAPLAIGDSNAAMHATTAILAAIYYREKTGNGQNIDISMTDCLFHSHEAIPPAYLFSGRTVAPVPIGRWHPFYAPYGLIKGQDGFIAIAGISDLTWDRLVKAMGEEYEWLVADTRTSALSSRLSNESAPFIHQVLEEWVMTFDSVDQVEQLLRKAKVPAMRVKDFEEASNAPYIQEREMIVKMKQPFLGEIEVYGSPFKMSETPGRVTGYAPLLGEHTRKILSGVLGYSDDKINSLFMDKVVYEEDAVHDLDRELGLQQEE
ncbi:MAG: CoA transferase, partial [candidate division Zixibacteria bacterium]